ncbi:putative multidrug resistance protein fnx1 [Massarina eburnea CBS 473.64]|uniref:Putative multidrug resistance protein fnx1 n=1 Tax=Massarina eburnea CBS 473.64 TaxID=1395130 RepID=A0A6A6S7B6_9PLEO|nr:putative multidrug resistance protein fnx1 [Massarina eburnea CBS 473.64]
MTEEQDSSLSTFQASMLVMEKSATMEKTQSEEAQVTASPDVPQYLGGLRKHFLMLGSRLIANSLYLSIFLVNFEISIVSTSLVSITNDFKQFGRISWAITAYLLTYTAFMVVFAKLSDTLGRKSILLSCIFVFVAFSGACGAAQTMNQLIVFRAFQGLGASGVYSLIMVILFELVPPELYPRNGVALTAVFAISLCTAPLLGGAINENTTWRWIFLLNVPAGTVGLVIVFLSLPKNFPHHGESHEKTSRDLKSIDTIGAALMLTAIILLITGFEEASNFSPWSSAEVLAPMLISMVVWIAFFFFERMLTLRATEFPEPVFPWRFCTSRVIMGIFMNAFLCGAVFTACVIQIPLLYQAVNGESPWHAGVRLIPFGGAVPFGAGLSAALCGKRRIPIIYMLFPALVFQAVGLVFMSRMTLDHILWKGQYGLQFMTGLGCGISMGVVTLMIPAVIERRDLATATATTVQVRMLGGALSLAVVTAVMNHDLNHTLAGILPPKQLVHIFQTLEAIGSISEPNKTVVRDTFLKGYNMQLRILIGFVLFEIPATLLMWQKDAVRIG